MKLADYLTSKGIKRNAFAAEIGVTPQTITGWCDGTFSPSMARATKIFELTDGDVTPNDFMETGCAA